MNQKELKELIEFLIEKDIAEFELERGDVKVKIKRAAEPAHARVARLALFRGSPRAGSGCGFRFCSRACSGRSGRQRRCA